MKAATAGQGRTWKRMRGYGMLYLMLVPVILTYAVFNYVPMYGLTLAFKDYSFTKGILGSDWVGLAHFRSIFAQAPFWRVVRNTVEINLLKLVFGFPAPIILALLLNELRLKAFKHSIQTIIYIPHFISWVTISGIIFALLSGDGLVNRIIAEFGVERINFLSEPAYFRPLLVLSNIWKEAGWGTIIFLAAMAGISPELYEAAKVDGAGRWRQTISVTLPCLAPIVSILLILNVGYLMTGGFDQIFNLYNPMVYEVGDVIDTYMYRIGLMEGRFSIATAVGFFLNIINFILLLTANVVSKRISGNGIY